MTNRKLALWWFVGFRDALREHFVPEYFDNHESNLRKLTRDRLRTCRVTWKARAYACRNFAIDTDEPDHGVQGWTRLWRVYTALSALYLLATGDKGRTEEETGVYCGDYNQYRETGWACKGCGMFSGHEDDPCPNCDEEVES